MLPDSVGLILRLARFVNIKVVNRIREMVVVVMMMIMMVRSMIPNHEMSPQITNEDTRNILVHTECNLFVVFLIGHMPDRFSCCTKHYSSKSTGISQTPNVSHLAELR